MPDAVLARAKKRLASYLKDRAKAQSDIKDAQGRLAAANKLIASVQKVIKRHDTPSVPSISGGRHPNATWVPYPDVGEFISVPAKLVWHTTEGSSLPTYSGSAPHFTLNPKTGELWQHIRVDRTALSLEHRTGTVETNRAHAIQVELIGFAKDTAGWPDSAYKNIAALARWIEKHCGVARSCSVTFSNTPHRFSDKAWLDYCGHCGHQHVPNQAHWDPGALNIKKVIA